VEYPSELNRTAGWALDAAVVLAFSSTSGDALQVLNKYVQPQSPNLGGRNTVEAAVIHEIACNGVAVKAGAKEGRRRP